MQTRDDGDLIRNFNGGDVSAFSEIVSRHGDRLTGLAWCILRNSADADDIVQETFVRAHRGLPGFRGDCALSTWLYRIASRLAFKRYHAVNRRRRHEVHPEEESADGRARLGLDNSPDPGLGPVGEVELAELAGTIQRCIRQLTPGHRRILGLRTGRRRSYGAIGRELGIDSGTVKSRLSRAREALRQRVGEAYPGV